MSEEVGSEPYSMLQWATVETAQVGDTTFVLARHNDDWVVRVDDRVLMSNRAHESEIALAEESIGRFDQPQRVLVGGLGLGYTLRAALDLVGEDSTVTVVELVPQLVEWNRKYAKELNDEPLDDPRCEVIVGDAYDLIARSKRAFDVIMLDVDNGPQALSQAKNQRLYGDYGVKACRQALTPRGVLGVWSSGPNAKYAARLERLGFAVDVLRVSASHGSRAAHILFIGET